MNLITQQRFIDHFDLCSCEELYVRIVLSLCVTNESYKSMMLVLQWIMILYAQLSSLEEYFMYKVYITLNIFLRNSITYV